MADATEREREAQLALDTAYEACAMDDYDVDRYCDARIAFRAAVRERFLADVMAVVEGMELHDPDERPEGGAAMYPYHLGQWIHRTDLLTRLRAMEGHTDG